MTEPTEPYGFLVLRCEDDRWNIWGDDHEGVAHGEAVAELERFIAEASQALAALRARREWPS